MSLDPRELHLSPRQRDVCAHVASGESDKWIAAELGCSVRTVRFHMEGAAKRLRDFCPEVRRHTTPRKVIHAYVVEVAGGVAFEMRASQRRAA